MKTPIPILSTIALMLSSAASLAQTDAGSKSSFDFNPVVMDSKNGSGSTVGAEFKFKGNLLTKSFDSKDSGDVLNPNATIGAAVIGYSGSGTVAASDTRNPKNFLEFQLDAKLCYSGPDKGTVLGGFFSKYEANQGFTNKQAVYGLGGTYGKYAVFGENDFVAFDANFGRVDPKDDTERASALGVATLDPYYRWNLEFLYMVPIQSANVKAIEFNYRYFQEVNASDAIKAATLDKQQLATLRVGLKNDFFLAYSAGKLPFNRKDDQIIQLGFSYKFN